MRAIWSGALNFGLVYIPIKLYSGSISQRLDFDWLDSRDLAPIKYARVNEETGREVPFEEIVKGYEYKKNQYVVLTEDDFEKVDLRKSNTIEINKFGAESDINPIYYKKPYYLEPEKGAERPYALLREALRKSGQVGIGTFAMRDRERLGMIKPMKDVLLLIQLRFAGEIRSDEELNLPSSKMVKKDELDLAVALINKFSGDIEINKYHDTYIKSLKKIIKAKIKGEEPQIQGSKPIPTKIEDLMGALKESLKKEASV